VRIVSSLIKTINDENVFSSIYAFYSSLCYSTLMNICGYIYICLSQDFSSSLLAIHH
jgi:hypothetical protein